MKSIIVVFLLSAAFGFSSGTYLDTVYSLSNGVPYVAVTSTNNQVTISGTNNAGYFSGNGGGITNLGGGIVALGTNTAAIGLIQQTNYILETIYSNATSGRIFVIAGGRCNPTTTLNARFGLAVDSLGNGTFSYTNYAGAEADTIFTTVPHFIFFITDILGPNAKFKVTNPDGNVTTTNSLYKVL